MNDAVHESANTYTHPSDAAVAYFQDCRRLLGISDTWNIWLFVADAPGGNEDADGSTALEARYLKANITIRREMTDARRPFVLMHEALHIVFAPLSLAYDRVIELLPESLQAHARELLCDAEEQIIEQLTRALQSQVRPSATDEPASAATAESEAGGE